MTKQEKLALQAQQARDNYDKGYRAGFDDGKRQAIKDINLEKVIAINQLVSNFGQTLEQVNLALQPIRS